MVRKRQVELTAPVGKFGDLAAANGPMTMHQAALPITVFGHRMSKCHPDIGNEVTGEALVTVRPDQGLVIVDRR